MGNSKSLLMLKYQKAKVKLREYEVPEAEWPSFPLNYRDLAYPTVLTISQYVEAINDESDNVVTYKALKYCSEFYDAALQAREQIIHDADFALSGAAAYFFMDNYGSAKVLWQEVNACQIIEETQRCLYDVFSLAFTGKMNSNTESAITHAIVLFWGNGDRNALVNVIKKYRESVYNMNSPQALFWGEIVCAVVRIIANTSARILLPYYSALENNQWDIYFNKKSAINLLWPSQRLVGASEILKGKNAIIQLPTGVGKTKSIELIIWSMFLSERGSKALIVVPLRSLCNEISYDLRIAFPKEVSINQFSDVLEDDFVNKLLGKTEKQILVCTPEKLQYIFHHDNSFLDALDLYIFDESHMFDDRSRGAMYELLLTDLKLRIKDKQQLVLMSAVLPNANQIVKWLLGEDGVLAYDSNIVSTPKSIGFADKNKQLHYYSSSEEEDFFVPYTYKTQKLGLLGREHKERFFPEDAKDRALYYTNILCKVGGVAIFFPQKRFIPNFFSRLKDLNERGCSLEGITNSSDADELVRFHELYKDYYGENYIYTQTVQYGILPHYSALPNGIKISTEYAFKKNKVKAVACTSTLAQGVNIPIKYLLITGTSFSMSQMSVRNFQNLIGRTGRAGVYTEGDVIVTESKLYDERNVGKGYYKWKETRELFDATAVEPCGSSILNVLKDFNVSHTVLIPGLQVAKYIYEKINDNNWVQGLYDALIKRVEAINPTGNSKSYEQELMDRVLSYKQVVDSIENEMIYLLSHHPLSETVELLREISNVLLENTLAYYIANDEERIVLKNLFTAIELKVENQIESVQKYSGVMVPMADADRIIDWIAKNDINTEKKSAKELLELIETIYEETYPSLVLQKGFALSWIRGDSYEQMSKDFEIKVEEAERICNHNVSYQMSFLVGNILDLVNMECVNVDALLLLQQALRYGVNTRTAVSICEKVFNDRVLAKKLAALIGNNGVSNEDIISVIRAKKEKAIEIVNYYPSYFVSIIESL